MRAADEAAPLSSPARAPRRVRIRRTLALVAITLSLSSAAPSQANGMISINDFVDRTQGTEQGQCIAFVEVYLREVYGVSIAVGPDANNSAYGLAPWYRAGQTLRADGFSWSSSTTNLQDGDILVFDKNSLADNGHTGIWYHGRIYDSNSEWSSRTTTYGAGVDVVTDAAIESPATTYNLLTGTGWSTPQPYLGRWRKTPPIMADAGTSQTQAGSSATPGS